MRVTHDSVQRVDPGRPPSATFELVGTKKEAAARKRHHQARGRTVVVEWAEVVAGGFKALAVAVVSWEAELRAVPCEPCGATGSVSGLRNGGLFSKPCVMCQGSGAVWLRRGNERECACGTPLSAPGQGDRCWRCLEAGVR